MTNMLCFKLWLTAKINLQYQNFLIIIKKFWISISFINSKILGWCHIRYIVIHWSAHQEEVKRRKSQGRMPWSAGSWTGNFHSELCWDLGLLVHLDFSIHYRCLNTVQQCPYFGQSHWPKYVSIPKIEATWIHDVWHLGASLGSHSQVFSQTNTPCLSPYTWEEGTLWRNKILLAIGAGRVFFGWQVWKLLTHHILKLKKSVYL